MGTKVNSKGQVVARAKQLIAGAEKHLANSAQVTFAGSSFTPAQITTKLQQVVTLRDDVDAAKASTKAKIVAEKADMPALRTFMSALLSFVKATFGNSPDVLAAFGVHPKARVPLTVEAKAAAAAKRKATRAARHTMGAKQKKDVRGAVTGIVVTPVTATPPSVTKSGPSAPATGGSTTTATQPHGT
ncbi:MAG TPA: hypothetical protein VGY54_05500 [Polyangiaceae bacterium]|jgi:hypothetical protein|nr:hypothetical protein [Polyangiaceae bacterium]